MFSDRKLRTRRLFNSQTGRTIILPMDHGVTLGPIAGIEHVRDLLVSLLGLSLNAVILHKGTIKNCSGVLFRDDRLSVVLHVSGSVTLSPHADEKVVVASVEDGLRLGVDGISVHVNLGHENDREMLGTLGAVSDQCDRYGLPLIAMMYCRGPGLDEYSEKNVAIAARVAMELGADIIKVSYTGSAESFRRVVKGIDVPVIMAGGCRKSSTRELLQEVHDALDAGAAGVALGRNVFQHQNPRALISALHQLINQNASVEEALRTAEPAS